MKLLALAVLLFSQSVFAFELKAGGALFFSEGRGELTAANGNSFFKYPAITRHSFTYGHNVKAEKKALLGLLLLNANVAAGKAIVLPEKSEDLIPFLAKFAETEQLSFCENGPKRAAFMVQIEELAADLNESQIALDAVLSSKEKFIPKSIPKSAPAAK